MAKSCNREICYFPHPVSSKQDQNLFTSEILSLVLNFSELVPTNVEICPFEPYQIMIEMSFDIDGALQKNRRDLYAFYKI